MREFGISDCETGNPPEGWESEGQLRIWKTMEKEAKILAEQVARPKHFFGSTLISVPVRLGRIRALEFSNRPLEHYHRCHRWDHHLWLPVVHALPLPDCEAFGPHAPSTHLLLS